MSERTAHVDTFAKDRPAATRAGAEPRLVELLPSTPRRYQHAATELLDGALRRGWGESGLCFRQAGGHVTYARAPGARQPRSRTCSCATTAWCRVAACCSARRTPIAMVGRVVRGAEGRRHRGRHDADCSAPASSRTSSARRRSHLRVCDASARRRARAGALRGGAPLERARAHAAPRRPNSQPSTTRGRTTSRSSPSRRHDGSRQGGDAFSPRSARRRRSLLAGGPEADDERRLLRLAAHRLHVRARRAPPLSLCASARPPSSSTSRRPTRCSARSPRQGRPSSSLPRRCSRAMCDLVPEYDLRSLTKAVSAGETCRR